MLIVFKFPSFFPLLLLLPWISGTPRVPPLAGEVVWPLVRDMLLAELGSRRGLLYAGHTAEISQHLCLEDCYLSLLCHEDIIQPVS